MGGEEFMFICLLLMWDLILCLQANGNDLTELKTKLGICSAEMERPHIIIKCETQHSLAHKSPRVLHRPG